MNDNMSPSPTAATPRANSLKNKIIGGLLLVVILAAAVAFVQTRPQPTPPQTSVGVAGANEALQAEMESLTARVQTLEAKVEKWDEGAPVAAAPESAKPDMTKAAELARLQSDMVALSSAMAGLQTEVKATGATATAARDVSTTLVASVVAFFQLREAAGSGRPFPDELASFREASKTDASLQMPIAKLQPYAAEGVPTLADLHGVLLAHEPNVEVEIAKGAAENWWQRLLAELQAVITVRHVTGGAGDVLTQLERSLWKGGAAEQEAFKQLPADAQKNLAGWQKQFDARHEVDQALRDIASRFTSLPAAKTP